MLTIFSNPAFSVFVTLLSIALTIIAITQARRNRRVKRIYATRILGTEVLNPRIVKENEIEFKFKGDSINGLFQIELSLKNTGTEIIRAEDFHESPFIKFSNEIVVINSECVATNDYVRPTLESRTGLEMELGFNILERGDKIDIKILYTAEHAAVATLHGRIIGGDELHSSSSMDIENQVYREGKSVGKIAYMLLIALLFGVFMIALKGILPDSYIEAHPNWVILFAVVPAWIIAYFVGHIIKGIMIDKRIRKLVRDGIVDPESLTDFFKSRLKST